MQIEIKYLVMKLSTLFLVLISFVGLANAQKFENHKIYLVQNGIGIQTVKVKPAKSFTIQKDGRMTWAKYKIGNGEVTFSAAANTTTNNRSCYFVLIDNNGNPVDTLEVIQQGRISTTGAKNVAKSVGLASSAKSNKRSTTTRKSTTSSSKSTYGGQCAARTKKGNRCSRQASAGSIYCWQHNR